MNQQQHETQGSFTVADMMITWWTDGPAAAYRVSVTTAAEATLSGVTTTTKTGLEILCTTQQLSALLCLAIAGDNLPSTDQAYTLCASVLPSDPELRPIP